MYAVDVDLVLRYVPPMDDHGHGIRMTWSFELPFPPSGDIAVHSREWEGIDDPLGYRLKEITWNIERSRFLGETEILATGTPIAMIPHEIRHLIKQGWQYGSRRTARCLASSTAQTAATECTPATTRGARSPMS